MLAALVCAVACTTSGPVVEPSLSVEGLTLSADNSVAVAAAGTDINFTVKGNVAFTVSSSQSWAPVSPEAVDNADSKDLSTAVKVAVAANESSDARDAVITVKTAKNPALDFSFTVKQAGAEAAASLKVTTTDLQEITAPMEVAETETTASVFVEANVAWTATSDKEWLTVSPASASAEDEITTVTFGIVANPDQESRTATVTFAGEGVDPVTVTVNQAAYVPFTGKAALMSVTDFNPDYLSQYPEETSLGAIWGKATHPVVSGYYGIWESSDWEEEIADWEGHIDSIIANVKKYGSQWPDQVLEAVNGEKGLFGTIFYNLNPGTEYILIILFEDAEGNIAVAASLASTKAVEYSGFLKVGDYYAFCAVEGETEEDGFESEQIFTLAPTTTENLFRMQNPLLNDGSAWYAYYDDSTKKLTLNGYHFGYEDYKNLFGSIYGWYNKSKLLTYKYESYAESFDEEGAAECVFSVNDEGYISGLDNYAFGCCVYQMDETGENVVEPVAWYNLFLREGTVITPYSGEEAYASAVRSHKPMSHKAADLSKQTRELKDLDFAATNKVRKYSK